MADRTPLFWQRSERGGERVFRLCPRGARIKQRGRAAGWRWESLGYVIMSILSPVAPQICATAKRSTWPGHGELIRLTSLPWEQDMHRTSRSIQSGADGRRRTSQRRTYCEATGSRLCGGISSAVLFLCTSSRRQQRSRERWVGREMLKQKCQFGARWDC